LNLPLVGDDSGIKTWCPIDLRKLIPMTVVTAPSWFRSFLVLVSSLLGLADAGLASQQPADPDPARFADEIRAFEASDRTTAPAPGQILFVGSSSIRRWDLEESFPGLDTLNRGFGGSQLSDVISFADRVITPYAPRAVVLYAGDNDIAAGKSADRVCDDVLRLARIVREEAPEASLIFLAIKPSLAREELWPEMKRANALIEHAFESDNRLVFADVATPMIGPGGRMEPELYVEDGLHLSAKGYEIWAKTLAPILQSPPIAGAR
jgi:lysophospholipase L1-like esterase